MGNKTAQIAPLQITPQGQKEEVVKIIFFYDFKNASKHFMCGTSVTDCLDQIKKYDDFDAIQYKRGLEIKKLTFYHHDEAILGYEIEYQDNKKQQLKLKRVASNFHKKRGRREFSISFEYNEHIADIEVQYSYEYINYIEVSTTKDHVFGVGIKNDTGYDTINKIDVNEKGYMAIVGFESTFSADYMKELSIYRTAVRISRRKQITALNVYELNQLKIKRAGLHNHQRAQKNLDKLRNLTRKSILQMRAIRAMASLGITKTPTQESNLTQRTIQNQEDENILEQRQAAEDFGIESGDEEEEQEEKKKKSPSSKKGILQKLFGFDDTPNRKQSGSKHKTQVSPTHIHPKRKTDFQHHQEGDDEERSPHKKSSILQFLGFGKKKENSESPDSKKSNNSSEPRSPKTAQLKKKAKTGVASMFATQKNLLGIPKVKLPDSVSKDGEQHEIDPEEEGVSPENGKRKKSGFFNWFGFKRNKEISGSRSKLKGSEEPKVKSFNLNPVFDANAAKAPEGKNHKGLGGGFSDAFNRFYQKNFTVNPPTAERIPDSGRKHKTAAAQFVKSILSDSEEEKEKEQKNESSQKAEEQKSLSINNTPNFNTPVQTKAPLKQMKLPFLALGKKPEINED